MEKKETVKRKETEMGEVKVNPLVNRKVFVRFVPHVYSIAGSSKAHPAYGAMMDGAGVKLCVPIVASTGNYKNILTNAEKDYLEEALGLDYNALSVYKRENNYWDNYSIRIPKEGLHLDLSKPDDYIAYKVLLANSNIIAPSVRERIERPKMTYKFEIVDDGEEASIENVKMNATMSSYKEFGKIENDFDTMRVLVELLDGKPYAQNTKPEFFRSRINILIQADPRKFLNYITDPMLHAKVVIRRSTELGKLSKRGDYYYLASDGTPLCDNGENPTLAIAAKYINAPAHQDLKFLLESEVDKNRK